MPKLKEPPDKSRQISIFTPFQSVSHPLPSNQDPKVSAENMKIELIGKSPKGKRVSFATDLATSQENDRKQTAPIRAPTFKDMHSNKLDAVQ